MSAANPRPAEAPLGINETTRRHGASPGGKDRREAAMKSLFITFATVVGIFAFGSTALVQSSPPAPQPPAESTTTTTTNEPSAQPLPVWLKLSAYSGKPGEKVSIAAAFSTDASPLTTKALRLTPPMAANAEGHQPWSLFAESVIADVAPASYSVMFHCGDGQPVETHLTVLAKEKTTKPQSRPYAGRSVPEGRP
jgi:hypothetical protein